MSINSKWQQRISQCRRCKVMAMSSLMMIYVYDFIYMLWFCLSTKSSTYILKVKSLMWRPNKCLHLNSQKNNNQTTIFTKYLSAQDGTKLVTEPLLLSVMTSRWINKLETRNFNWYAVVISHTLTLMVEGGGGLITKRAAPCTVDTALYANLLFMPDLSGPNLSLSLLYLKNPVNARLKYIHLKPNFKHRHGPMYGLPLYVIYWVA